MFPLCGIFFALKKAKQRKKTERGELATQTLPGL